MTDAEATRRTRKPAIGDQRHLLADPLAIERRRRRQHLAHPGTAARPLIADDDDVAFAVLTLLDRLEGVLLAIEAARRSAEAQRLHPGDLDDGALRREVALEHGDPAGRRQWLRGRTHHVLPLGEDDIAQILGDGPAGDGDAVAVQIAAVEQRL